MENRDIIEKWLSVFGEGVDKKIIEEHVTSHYNHLWHLFTWGNVSCLAGNDARRVDKDEESDVYIVAKDFSWTYVRTHEPDLGPYLCVKK